ncbi:hypothetical protein [Aquibium sp. ELW1220]|uniref:hypothetical protein n=1 Tax=Aquibium sp. ELW1220 TaxID=2976766 RepID=UPI0025B0CDDA|nr:hypothetical protein [Aquibium sp. ELW1220]MDN2579457.1 hypothetical protein [Aquibium sp. ELW1220]
MPFRHLPFAAIATVLAVPPASAAAAPPQEIVRLFYQRPGAETDPALRSHFTDPARTILDDNDKLKAAGEGECLDPNLAFGYAEPTPSEIGAAVKLAEVVRGEQATVVATFTAGGSRHRMEWRLVLVDGAWKVADFLSADGELVLSRYNCE